MKIVVWIVIVIFIITMIIIVGKLFMKFVNKYTPNLEDQLASNTIRKEKKKIADIKNKDLSIIIAAVDSVTGGKGNIESIQKH